MNRRESLVMLGAAVMAGVVGGVISGNLFQTESVIAQETSPTAKVITAEEFRLVDQEGRTRAVLGMDTEGTEPSLVFFTKEGANLVRLGLKGFFPELSFLSSLSGKPKPSIILSGLAEAPSISLLGFMPGMLLKDKEGNNRISLRLAGSSGYLWLQDENKKFRVSLGVGKNGEPSLRLSNKDGKERAVLNVKADGGSYLGFLDENGGDDRVLVGMDPDTTPILRLRDKEGKKIAALTIVDGQPNLFLGDIKMKTGAFLGWNDGKPNLIFTDDGPVRARLALRADGSSELRFHARDGDAETVIGMSKYGFPSLNFRDDKGTTRVSLGVGPDQPVIGIKDGNGKVIWAAP